MDDIEDRMAKAAICVAIGHAADMLFGTPKAGKIVGFIVSLWL
jgi:hypothetical protein